MDENGRSNITGSRVRNIFDPAEISNSFLVYMHGMIIKALNGAFKNLAFGLTSEAYAERFQNFAGSKYVCIDGSKF